MKEENFASVASISRVWFSYSDEALYTHCLKYSTTANFLSCGTIFFFLRVSCDYQVHAHRIAGSFTAHNSVCLFMAG